MNRITIGLQNESSPLSSRYPKSEDWIQFSAMEFTVMSVVAI